MDGWQIACSNFDCGDRYEVYLDHDEAVRALEKARGRCSSSDTLECIFHLIKVEIL
ncbi:MAG: hypothetical protein ACTSRA_00955 [Promethearchaeota archaeon]